MYESLSMDGTSVAPRSGGAPKQLVLFLHGLGADAHDLIGLADEFAEVLPDAQFLSPNAPFYCDMSPMGRQWFSLQSRESAHMLTGIEASRPLLDAFIDISLKAYGLTLDRLIVIGFSQGTMMALHTLLRRPAPCAAIVGFSGAIVGSKRFAGEITAKPPVCLIHGEADTVVPFAAMPDAEAALASVGVPVEAHAEPHLAHGISPRGIGIAKAFLGRVVR